MTKSDKLLGALSKRPMSVKQIISNLKIPNPRATVHYLRTQGYKIRSEEVNGTIRYSAV